MARRIAIYRYKYRNPPATQTTSPPPYSPTLPLPPMSSTCEYLESPQDITEPGITKIVVRERGGPTDNHVQWVRVQDVEPVTHLSHRGTTWVHGNMERDVGNNEYGHRLWLRSDQPIQRGRSSVPAVNLDTLENVEVRIKDVQWRAVKQEKEDGQVARLGALGGHGVLGSHGTVKSGVGRKGKPPGKDIVRREGEAANWKNGGGPLALIGPEYYYDGYTFRMCLWAGETPFHWVSNGRRQGGIIEVILVEDLERYYDDVEDNVRGYLYPSML